jgi:hypothetical protein
MCRLLPSGAQENSPFNKVRDHSGESATDRHDGRCGENHDVALTGVIECGAAKPGRSDLADPGGSQSTLIGRDTDGSECGEWASRSCPVVVTRANPREN